MYSQPYSTPRPSACGELRVCTVHWGQYWRLTNSMEQSPFWEINSCPTTQAVWSCSMHHASCCNVYISRPTRYTNSYNESLLIIKRSTCFGVHHQERHFLKLYRSWYNQYVLLLGGYGKNHNHLTARCTGYTNCDTTPKRRSWWWTLESETCRALND